MKVPPQLQPLMDDGIIDEVLRPLTAGKEAAVYVVIAQGRVCCAKVYKDAANRSFRQRATYQEGRRVQNTRRARAMDRGSRYGKRELEAEWQNAEVDALRVLSAAGVRVPRPLNFTGGVLLMELITDANGDVAPRLTDQTPSPETARAYHRSLIGDVAKMLCAGLIHGDLSEYNILVDADGPVIIDLPQAVDAAANNSARRMLRRDVDNLAAYFGRFAPELAQSDYGREIWQLYQSGALHPTTELTGRYRQPKRKANLKGVLAEIDDARKDAERRREGPPRHGPERDPSRGILPDVEEEEDSAAEGRSVVSPTGRRRAVDLSPRKQAAASAAAPASAQKRRRRRRREPGSGAEPPAAARTQAPVPNDSGTPPASEDPGVPKRRRRRRRGPGPGTDTEAPAAAGKQAPALPPSGNRGSAESPEAPRRRRRRRRGSGGGQASAAAPPSDANAPADPGSPTPGKAPDRPPKRRRRRRRGRPVTPP